MHRVFLLAIVAGCVHASPQSPTPTPTASPTPPAPVIRATPIEHPGCFMLARTDGSEAIVVHPEDCAIATTPASTFKIPHALIALQLGIVTDPDKVEPWDKSPQWMKQWERDHSLRTAIRDSVVWFFQRLAPQIGRERMEEWLAKMHYGNADASGPIRKFWLDGGSLQISGTEQFAFVQQLFAGKLPIDRAHVDTVTAIIRGPIEDWASRLPDGETPPVTTATFRAKTGTDTIAEGTVTWWVGSVEGPRGTWVFTSRMRVPGEPSRISPAVREGMRALAAAGVL